MPETDDANLSEPTRPGFFQVGPNIWQRLPEDHPESLINLALAKHKRERQEATDPSDEAILANNVDPEELARIQAAAEEAAEADAKAAADEGSAKAAKPRAKK